MTAGEQPTAGAASRPGAGRSDAPRGASTPQPSAAPVFGTILRWQAIVAALVAILGGAIGFAFVGFNGIWSALVAAAIAFAFAAITVVALIFAARRDLTWFFGIILGSWLLKFVLFLGALLLVRDQPWIHPIALFACLVVAIVATVGIDVLAVLRSRVPYVDPDARS